MKPAEYSRLALELENRDMDGVAARATAKDSQHSVLRLLHATLGVAGEAGELVDQVKRHLYYGTKLDPTNILEECGDTLWYLALALDACGLTIEDAMKANIAKLQKRNKGRQFNQVATIMRDTAEERKVLEGGVPRVVCPNCGLAESDPKSIQCPFCSVVGPRRRD